MRLVGIALLAAWLVAWAVAPRGEPDRQTSIVGAVAVAGGDRAAAAWLEVRHRGRRGEPTTQDSIVHVVQLDPQGGLTPRIERAVSLDAASFRLLDAGEGRFVLATEHRARSGSAVGFVRFGGEGGAVDERIPELRSSYLLFDQEQRSLLASPAQGLDWQLAAAQDQLAVVETHPFTKQHRLHVLAPDRTWISEEIEGRTLIGAGEGHVVAYVENRDRTGSLRVDPGQPGEWRAEVARPVCFTDGGAAPTVTAVVGLRGGYARLSRRGSLGCVDGLREGRPFAARELPLDEIPAARLQVADDGHLEIYEEQQPVQLQQPRVELTAAGGYPYTVQPPADAAARYRLFGGRGRSGVTVLTSGAVDGETRVMLNQRLLAPMRSYQADYRPTLRRLAPIPLVALFLAVLGAWRLPRRARSLAILPPEAPLRPGPAVLEGELSADADAPTGALRMRHGRQRVTVFIEGAEVLRASDVRPRSQPRGDAVDVAAGAKILATGIFEPGQLYRDEASLRARRGDLVLVGCTLAEARRRLASRLAASAAIFALASYIVGALTLCN